MAKIIAQNPEQINESQLVTLVEERYKEAENEGLERQWYLNIAYLTGKQWIAYDRNSRRLFEPPKESHEERVTINRIRPAIRTELAKVTKSKPQFQGIPRTNEDEDIDAAKLATKALEHVWKVTGMDNKRLKLGLWQLSTGTVILKAFWDKSTGQIIDEEGTRLGDVANNVVSPFDFRFDPSVDDFEEARWCVEQKMRTTDYALENYNVEVGPEDGLISTNIFSGLLANLNGLNNTAQERKVKNGVIVKEYWELPSKKHPKGRHITIAGGKLLQYEDNRYNRLPYFIFVHIPVPGRAHGSSIIEDLIPVQREHNKTRSQRRMNQNRTGNQRLLVEQDSLLNTPTNEPGEVVEYRRGSQKPDWESPPPEPAHIQAELELQLKDFEDVGSIHQVSQGSAPAGIKSGIALSILQEQDETVLGPTVHANEASWEKWAKFELELVQENYIEPRLIRLSGKNNSIDAFEFQGADLKGNTDVEVIAGSTLPKSAVARQEFVLNLWGQKIITDPKIALKLMEFGTIEEVYEEIAIDENQAKSEQKQWLSGDLSHLTRDFYNHEVHIAEHNKFRKGEDYEQLPPELQTAVDQHVQEHIAYVQQQLAMMQPQIPGQPPGPQPGPMEGGGLIENGLEAELG